MKIIIQNLHFYCIVYVTLLTLFFFFSLWNFAVLTFHITAIDVLKSANSSLSPESFNTFLASQDWIKAIIVLLKLSLLFALPLTKFAIRPSSTFSQSFSSFPVICSGRRIVVPWPLFCPSSVFVRPIWFRRHQPTLPVSAPVRVNGKLINRIISFESFAPKKTLFCLICAQ